MKRALVCGGGGFIGSHLVKRLKKEGYWVRAVDLKLPEFKETVADDFVVGDLRDLAVCHRAVDKNFEEVYQLAADMGGAGYIFTGENDANVMHNSAMINLNMVDVCHKRKIKKIFYSSSACIYPEHNQMDPDNPTTEECTAYPANPDSEYGWEKLFSERLYFAYRRNFGMDVKVARFHNVYGPEGSWNNGKEKAPAAICRKVVENQDGGEMEIWGDGKQTRSFLFIEDCLDAIRAFMEAEGFHGPVNIGSEEMVTINRLAEIVMDTGNKKINIKHISGPLGVRGRSSHNRLIEKELNWIPKYDLKKGLKITYDWISEQHNDLSEK